jgi:hypothetical protein
MNQATTFRFLVVTSSAAAVLGACLDSFVPGLLPTALEDAYDAYAAAEEPSVSYLLALGGLSLVLLICGVAGTIGLLLFKPWGRLLSLWVSLLAALSCPFLGPAVCSGWTTMLTEASMMLWGAALAMAYFAEVRLRFDRDATDNALRPTREGAHDEQAHR